MISYKRSIIFIFNVNHIDTCIINTYLLYTSIYYIRLLGLKRSHVTILNNT